MLRSPLRAAPVLAALWFAVLPCSARAQCPASPALSTGVSVATASDPAVYSVTPGNNRWSAVGVRAGDAMNWNIEARDATAAFPACFSGVLANSSAASGIDFVVTDWRFRTAQTDYIGAGTSGQTGTAARVQYEQAQYSETVNLPFDQLTVASNDVLRLAEVQMFAGVQYFIQISPSAGLTGLKLHVYEPVTSGNGWVPRSGQALEQALATGGNLITYTATGSGIHALVVTNESATSGTFYLAVKSCPSSASAMSDNTPRITVALDDWPGLVPTSLTWGAAGVRGTIGLFYDWDVAPGLRLQNGPFMTCTDSLLAEQASGLGAKVIAGDFRSNPLRFYTAHASLEGQPKTFSEGYMEWEDGQDSIVVNASPTVVSPPANNVLDAWSVRLVKGGNYHVQVTPAGGATANYKAMLFANPNPGSGYWATRPDAVAEATSFDYHANATGLYGLVVANDNGGTGGYSVSLTSNLLGVGPSPVDMRDGIRAVMPNPAHGPVGMEVTLARAGSARLRVTDVAGRTVAELPLRAAAGAQQATWNGRAEAGVYFVTLLVDGRARDRATVIRLR